MVAVMGMIIASALRKSVTMFVVSINSSYLHYRLLHICAH